ncbi:GlsB/YeaQ/YmgE family stress response membrane protein [Lentzea sp. NPDC059081]|uniref:GlsB/YeaQ/YmgE family stress response membrane protein n=1 Tax=Lentzea sp. NPDC059081 TaxID=3346719 RepID=UPI00368E547F
MGIGSIIGALVIGLVLGVLGRLFAPGKQNIPIWLTILVGIVAAFIGTWIARLLGVEDTPGIDWIELIVQIVVAAVGVSVVAGMYGKKSVS